LDGSESSANDFLFGYLQKLKEDLKIVSTLGKLGVTDEIIHHLAAKAICDPCNATNPRSPKQEDLEEIYHSAL
jgi:alcohol dehydrogenase class IV